MNAPPAPQVKLVGERTVMDSEVRTRSGLRHWIDGTFGVVGRHGGAVSISPNGPRLAVHVSGRSTRRFEDRHDGSTSLPFDRLMATQAKIRGLPRSVSHASGGPALYDHVSDRISFVYHAEEHLAGDHRSYMSSLGLATSSDGGQSFDDNGTILTSWLPEQLWRANGGYVELGPGSFVVQGDRLLLFFQDKSPWRRVNLSMATTSATDAMAAIRTGTPWRLQKHGGIRPDGPGIGGESIELLPVDAAERSIEWFDIGTVDVDGPLLLVYSSVVRGWWALHAATSWDGLTWSAPSPVLDSWRREELLYVTIWSGNPTAQRTVVDGMFDIVCVRSNIGGFDRWREADIVSFTVSIK